jgi:hypothetical protein
VNADDIFEARGGVKGRWLRASYPFGRLKVTRETLVIDSTIGIIPTVHVTRGEVRKVELRRSKTLTNYLSVVRYDGVVKTRFIAMDGEAVATGLLALGWPCEVVTA